MLDRHCCSLPTGQAAGELCFPPSPAGGQNWGSSRINVGCLQLTLLRMVSCHPVSLLCHTSKSRTEKPPKGFTSAYFTYFISCSDCLISALTASPPATLFQYPAQHPSRVSARGSSLLVARSREPAVFTLAPLQQACPGPLLQPSWLVPDCILQQHIKGKQNPPEITAKGKELSVVSREG